MRARLVEIDRWDAVVDQLTLRAAGSLATAALIFAATFQQDVTAVRQVRGVESRSGFWGCVAAGLDEFGRRLGPWAEGVLEPAQWWCRDGPVDVGPTGPQFVCVVQASALVIIADVMIKRGLGRALIRCGKEARPA